MPDRPRLFHCLGQSPSLRAASVSQFMGLGTFIWYGARELGTEEA